MRTALFISLFLVSCAASVADTLQIAQQLNQAGAPQLALARVVRDQPAQPNSAAWYEWESLRLTLLSETQQPAEIVARAALYPKNAPRDFLQKALGHEAWAELALKHGAAARALLARLIWRFDLNPADQQWARRLVIRSYLVDHKAEDAYRAMLRYQQDFQPLPKDVAAEFAQGLLAQASATEAMTWLAELDPANPMTLALQMQAGLIAPEAAIAKARKALQKQANAASYAAIIADGAALLKDNRQRIAALEQWLGWVEPAQDGADRVTQLWHAYLQQADGLGNRAQVLQGEDAAWLELALRTESSDTLGARALYAYVAQHGSSDGVRETALSRLYAALITAQMEGTAVRLFNAAPWGGEKIMGSTLDRLLTRAADGLPDAATRALYFTAGRMLEERHDALGAADYYAQAVLKSDLRKPDGLATLAVQRTVASLERAGFKDDAAQFYRKAMAQKSPQKKPVLSKGKRKP
jgi:hypothetical protein